MNAQSTESTISEDGIRAVQELLGAQAIEVEALSKELAVSYEKEITFFNSLSRRDLQLEKERLRSQKRISWLESERRKTQEALAESEKQVTALRDDLEATRKQRDALRASVGGRIQRAYWRVLKKIKRGGRA